MQQKVIAFIICVSIFMLTSCSNQLTQTKITTIENAVLDVHTKLVAAAENRDADGMFEYILDSEETVIQVGDIAQDRQQTLESVRKNFKGLSKIQYEFQQRDITVLKPDTAEMATQGKTIDTTHDGRVFTYLFTQKLLFILTDDGWKIKYAHHIIENN